MRLHQWALGLLWLPAATVLAQTALPLAAPATGAVANAPINGAAATAPDSPLRMVLGAQLSSQPSYAGSDTHELTLQPVLYFRYGRWRLSSSRGSALADSEGASVGPGLGTNLLESERLTLGASIRAAGGRSAADDARLSGLPEVRRTVRLRLGANYALTPAWSLNASLAPDLLGRAGGVLGAASLNYGRPLTPQTQLELSLSLSAGDATYMSTQYGVAAEHAIAGTRPAYHAGAGLERSGVGLSLRTALDKNWVVFGGLGVSRLQGAAADSPLTLQRSQWGVSVGLAWRQ